MDRDSVEPFAAQQRLPRLGADGTLRVPVGELKPGPNVLRDAIAGRPGR